MQDRKIDMAANSNPHRADFPALLQHINGAPLVYLDSAASALKPRSVIRAMASLMEGHYANIHRGLYRFSQQTTSDYEAARKKIASFINVKNENEIIFTRNTTEGINLIAQSWGRANLAKGDEIILTEMEHHANIVPWQMLREEKGVVIKVVPVDETGTLDLEAYKNLLSERTKLVSIVHVSNALGTINSIKEINGIAKSFNPEVKVIVDGCQAVVHMPVDVQALDCDFYVFTGHKLYGPTGIGVLWGKYDVLAAMPPYQGGGDMIESVSWDKVTYKAPPARFEAGTPAIIEAVGLGAAVEYLSSIGMEEIAAREAELLYHAQRVLAEIDGVRFYGMAEEKAGILSFTVEWGDVSDIAMILDEQGIAVRTGHHCCEPLMARFGIRGTIRASIGLYNTIEDIDALAAGIKKAKGLLT